MLPNNIYFLLGVPCAGKTTIANILTKKYGMAYFSGDEKRFFYFKKADKANHPAMSRNMPDYYDLPVDYLIQWERDVIKEQTPMIISDLIDLSKRQSKVLFGGIMDLGLIAPSISKNRVVYLTVSREIRKRDFFNRSGHIKRLENINNSPDISAEEKQRRIDLKINVAIDFCHDDVSHYKYKAIYT